MTTIKTIKTTQAWRAVSRVEAEKLYNAGQAIYRRRAKKGPMWLKSFKSDTWNGCCEQFAGWTQTRFYVLEAGE
jgi:hypothetical protein